MSEALKKQQRCALVAGVIFSVLAMLLVLMSFEAVLNMTGAVNWAPRDYWLAWFSGLSLVAAIPSTIVAGINIYIAMDCTTP